jgi:hypothetical protein
MYQFGTGMNHLLSADIKDLRSHGIELSFRFGEIHDDSVVPRCINFFDQTDDWVDHVSKSRREGYKNFKLLFALFLRCFATLCSTSYCSPVIKEQEFSFMGYYRDLAIVCTGRFLRNAVILARVLFIALLDSWIRIGGFGIHALIRWIRSSIPESHGYVCNML